MLQESRFLEPANPFKGDLVASEPFGWGQGEVVRERGNIDAGVDGFLDRVCQRRWCSANLSLGLAGYSHLRRWSKETAPAPRLARRSAAGAGITSF